MQTTFSDRARRQVLPTIMLTLFMEMLGASLINVAIPSIKADLHPVAAHWLISAYALGFGMALLLAGHMADVWGHRAIHLLGMAIFTLSSACCTIAPDMGQLVAARIGQGIGNAMVAPQILAFMQILYSPVERVQKLPYIGISAALGTMLGPILGGALITQDMAGMGWRIVFATDAAGGLLTLVCGMMFLPGGTARRQTAGTISGTISGTVLLAAITAAITLACMGWAGWNRFRHPAMWLLPVGVVTGMLIAMSALARRRRRADGEGLLPPGLARQANLLIGAAMFVGLAASNNSFMVIFNLALQHGRGHTPLVAGLMYLPFGLGTILGITMLGRPFLVDHGRRVLALGALVLAGGTTAVMAILDHGDLPVLWAVPACVVAGIGAGMSAGCVGPVAVAWVGVQDAGKAAALLRMGQQMGLVLGSMLVVQPYLGGMGTSGQSRSMVAMLTLQGLLALVAILALRLHHPLFPPLSSGQQQPAARACEQAVAA